MTIILVVMPIGSDSAYAKKQQVIRDAVEQLGFSADFPDYDPADPRFSTSEFSDQLHAAQAVLADLSAERPSCYYELGFAEALRRPVCLIAEQGTLIHQSAYRNSVHFYHGLGELADTVARTLSPLTNTKVSAEQSES